MERINCLEQSPGSHERTAPEGWAIQHTVRNRGHDRFGFITTSFMRATPAPGNLRKRRPPVSARSTPFRLANGLSGSRTGSDQETRIWSMTGGLFG